MGRKTGERSGAFSLHRSGRIRIFYDDRLLPGKSLAFFERLPEKIRPLPARRSRSVRMESIWELEPQSWFPRNMIARQHVHGGICGRLAGPLRTLFIDPAPMTGELQIARHLLRCGLPVSRPLVLRLENKAGPFFTAILVSEKIEGVMNLLQACRLIREGDLTFTASARRRLLENAAAAIARMHENRVCHGDLNLKNMLVRIKDRKIGEKIYIIDFKKAVLTDEPVPLQKGIANVRRLWRSIEKWPDSAAVFGPPDRTALMELYRARR